MAAPDNPANYRKMEGTSKNTTVFVADDNYIYTKDKVKGIAIYLRCADRRNGCPGTASIVNGVLIISRKHDHESSASEVRNREAKSRLKYLAETTREPLKSIHDNVSREMGGIDVPLTQAESAMNKRRRLSQPPVPSTIAEFRQALGDYGPYRGQVETGDKLALVFAGDKGIWLLACAKESIHVDATFKVVPPGFYQLLVIHVLKDNAILPAVYVLMTAKTRVLYDGVFRVVHPNF